MSKKLLVAACIVLVAALGSQAQNARIGAMANIGNVKDISLMLTNPAYMNDYLDVIQGTLDGTSGNILGPFIGTKGITDMFSAGLTYQNASVLNGLAFASMTAFLGTTPGITLAPATDINPIPHFLVGINLDALQLGFDLYWERAFYSSKTVNQPGPAPALKTTTTIKGSFSNIGLVAGASVGKDQIPVSAYIGGSYPSVSGRNVAEVSDGSLTSTIQSSNLAYSLKLGVDATPQLGDMEWKSGVSYDMVYYGRNKTVSKTVTAPPPTTTETTTETGNHDYYHYWRLFSGLVKNIESENLILAGLISANMTMDRSRPDVMTLAGYDPGTTTNNLLWLSTHAGTEKVWKELKYLDAIQARAGLDYFVNIPVSHENGDTAEYTHTARVQNWANHSGFSAYVGMGVTKKRFQFDVQINPIAILNTFKLANGTGAGNDLAKATVTLDFGSDVASSSSSSSGSSSTPASGYQTPSFGGSSTTPAPSTDPGTGTTTTTPGF
jgi:hypothetical protein